MVMRKSQIHQRGSGLLYSFRSSSQTWPVVSASVATLRRESDSSSSTQPTMPASVIAAMKKLQKPPVKSLMVVERLPRRLLEAPGVPAAPGPHHDADEGRDRDHRDRLAKGVDVHQRTVLGMSVPRPCR